MEVHPDPSSNPTEPPQLLSAKFLRKAKLRKEDLSNEHAEAPTAEMTTNATNTELKEKRESVTTVPTARYTSDTVSTNSAVQTSGSPPPEALEATPISEENELPNNRAPSSPGGTTSLAQSNTLTSSSPVSLISSLPTNLKSRLDTLESSFPLSPEELDHAKTLVLDLLGWGVDPEYLIDSGVSAEVVFRVFMDLNLRLPKNLVISQELVNVAYSWGPRPSEFTQSV